MEIRPQAGPQEMFLSTPADIAVYGGSAGGGKTFGLLFEGMRHIGNPSFGGTIFRRQSTQIHNEGGMWDESEKLYPMLGGRGIQSKSLWKFESGAKLKFAHLEHEKTLQAYQGAQIPFIGWDELTHFSKKQFFYMLTRNRSTSGVKPYMRATCNPDPDSFVADLISWWINWDTGYAIPERSGVIRYLVKRDEDMTWAASVQELVDQGYNAKTDIKSFTFIASSIFDNKILLEKDPGYLANLNAQDRVTREQLLHGNWKIRANAGMVFRRSDFKVVDAAPSGGVRCRGWDIAATEKKTAKEDPDWTVGLRMSRVNNCYYIDHVERFRESPGSTKSKIINQSRVDGLGVRISIPQDPGSAGKIVANDFTKDLAGLDVRTSTETGDKVTRAMPLSAQVEAGNVYLIRGPWNEAFIKELESFPGPGHDDQVDAASRAFNELTGGPTSTMGKIRF